MSRCDYDAVFYRVFCVTLLVIAFTFTVILTNVFIDIDRLISSKKDKHTTHISDNSVNHDSESEATDNYEINYGDHGDSYRTKRSIETQSFLFHIKNPKVKNILATRLSTLLEELDAEEPAEARVKDKKTTTEAPKEVAVTKQTEAQKEKKEDELLHLTMHNILLQGIIGHMDLSEVYKKVHSLISRYQKYHDKEEMPKFMSLDTNKAGDFGIPKRFEEKLFDELVNCDELQEQIKKAATKKDNVKKPAQELPVAPSVLIKTTIDIKSPRNNKIQDNDVKVPKENVKGIIELVYNGKLMKFTHPDAETVKPPPQKNITTVIKPKEEKPKAVTTETITKKVVNDYNTIPKSFMDKFVEEYFKRYPRETNNDIKQHLDAKRLKRHVDYDFKSKHAKKKHKKKPKDDELYVEIETHFDSKGMKGDRKKELIKGLIEKIQKAIHSDSDIEMKPKTKHEIPKRRGKVIHFKKRIQNPLEHSNNVLKYSIPLDGNHRQLQPISKTINPHESSPYIGSRYGEEWKKPYYGPGFLTSTKTINSAEMSEVDVEYSKVLDVSGIPQRQQLPLNADSEDDITTNPYFDLGNMKVYIKDIDGTGFSVGFNQFVDAPPDAETMKLFTGLENVIKTYHQDYDAPGEPVASRETNFKPEDIGLYNMPNNGHTIQRRSTKKHHDYHSNEYKIIYEDDFMPYNSYKDIFQTNKFKPSTSYSTKHYDLPLVVDEKIFEKNLKPAEIFGLANLFERKKRSVKVKKISNMNGKIKLNRYLNTNAMSTKRIFLNKKRNKRQLNKIRIIASDMPHSKHRHSDENVFVVSDENVFADRALKEVENSEMEQPEKMDEQEPVYIPFQNQEEPTSYITNIFDQKARHNTLMSKYPHIFMEEVSKSREEYVPNNSLIYGKLPLVAKFSRNMDDDKIEDQIEDHPIITFNDTDTTKILKEHADIANGVLAPNKSNYKVTVKITPKNQTGVNSGIKEIHTSINKRFNKNGLQYTSLVNVSEISKVTSLNGTKDTYIYHKGVNKLLAKKIRDRHEMMQSLLKQHAQHVDEQLKRLNEEKHSLEGMLAINNLTDITFSDLEDFNDNLRQPKTIETVTPTTTILTTTTQATTPLTTILTTTPVPVTTPQLFPEILRRSLLTTIERNGNLTDQILKKIDRNTAIVQAFLRKLTEKVLTPSIKEEKTVKKEESTPVPTEWIGHGLPFNQNNVVLSKNDSQIGIPFLYAYQHPITPLKDTPVANVVYHGHIHANTIHPKNTPKSEKDNVKVAAKMQDHIMNQTRFFIDELENDYKVIQVGNLNKNHEFMNVSYGNNTLA